MMDRVGRCKALRYRRGDVCDGRMRTLETREFLSVQEHEQRWCRLDVVLVRKVSIERDINAEDSRARCEFAGNVLQNRLKRSAVCAAVRHKLDDDRSFAGTDEPLERVAGNGGDVRRRERLATQRAAPRKRCFTTHMTGQPEQQCPRMPLR